MSLHGSDRKDPPAPSDTALIETEDTALELARLARAEIQGALGRTLAIRYKKSAEGAAAFRDPVSEVDHESVEAAHAAAVRLIEKGVRAACVRLSDSA